MQTRRTAEVSDLLQLTGQLYAQAWGVKRLTSQNAEALGGTIAAHARIQDFALLCAIVSDSRWQADRKLRSAKYATSRLLAPGLFVGLA